MSHYDKKYIKGDLKKYDCKEEHKHHCKFDDYKDEHFGKECELDVDQDPSVTVTTTARPNLLTSTFATTEVCVDAECDQVVLDTTVNWQPNDFDLDLDIGAEGLGIAALILAILELLTGTGIFIPLAIPATFRIWRKSKKSSKPVLISGKFDTSGIFGLQILGSSGLLGIVFSPITTSIHAVDTDPDCGENEYFLTINTGPFPEGTIFLDLSTAADPAGIPVGTSGVILTPDNVTSHTFTALELDCE
ncbi:hypothetical protein [Priestia megaterium]|uniref:hypothetical protein n=1 Tax=Priestia megaterium TaxID=1404 RepID=UPI00046EC4E5|nr:hypothetical protein [Priestia megaterium]PFB03858.1 hypothetical protein CN383_07250 [Priestia megaterium]PFR93141.1 hypothetical protein COK39_18825 [Priestia megaterium]TCN10073.1 hypothetical protein EV581_105390 [Bacillus sp. BK006]